MDTFVAHRQEPPTNASALRVASRFRLGGISAMASGVLLLIKSALDVIVGAPPSDPVRLLAWLTSHQLPLALVNEILFFSAVLLIPAVLALYRSLHGSDRPWVAFGCGMLAMAVPVTLVLVVVHGRLMYPVYGIELHDPATIALVVSLYYGGAHAATLLLGAALIILGLAMRRGSSFGPARGAFGVAAGTLQIAGAYPWLIGPLLTAIMQAMFAAWLVVVGMRLARPLAPSRQPRAFIKGDRRWFAATRKSPLIGEDRLPPEHRHAADAGGTRVPQPRTPTT